MTKPLEEYTTDELLQMLPTDVLESIAGLKKPWYQFSTPEVELPLKSDKDLLPDPFLMIKGVPQVKRRGGATGDFSERRIDLYGPTEATPVSGPVDTGIPEHAPINRAMDMFVQHAVNEALAGVPFAMQKEMGEIPLEPQTTGEKIAAGAGSLTGFVVGLPGKVTKEVGKAAEKGFEWLALKGTEKFIERTGKAMAKEAPALGAGMVTAAIGEASRQKTLGDSLGVLYDAFESGAQMGATFGLAKGMFPKDTGMFTEWKERIGRIATGMALLDAERMQHPLDERELAQKVFDYGMDTFFLWRGMPDYQFKKIERDIFANLEAIHEKLRTENTGMENIINKMEGRASDGKKESTRQETGSAEGKAQGKDKEEEVSGKSDVSGAGLLQKAAPAAKGVIRDEQGNVTGYKGSTGDYIPAYDAKGNFIGYTKIETSEVRDDRQKRSEEIHGSLGGGEEPRQALPLEEEGGKTIEAGGDVQAQEKSSVQVVGADGAKINLTDEAAKEIEDMAGISNTARITPKLPWEETQYEAGGEEAKKPEDQAAAPGITGKKSTAVTERGTRIDTQFKLVEADDLIASHDTSLNINPKYPQEVQPRQRERAASKDQVDRIANKLIPDLLGDNPKASEGAPIVGKDNVVESGNARIIALKRIYDTGHGNAEVYKKWLMENAETFGLDPAEISTMKNPILTRERQTELDRAQFAREANESGIASMSATEQALADANMLDDGILDLFVQNDAGDINTANNYPFMRGFFQKVVGTDTGRYMTKDGGISQEGVLRIRNALFAKAYGNAGIVEKLAESPDPNIRNILNAMVQAAPKMAKVNALIASGARHDLSLSAEIGEAARKLSYLREQGMNIDTYLRQADMFADISPLAKDVISMFNYFKRSARKIAAILDNYVDIVHEIGDPRQKGLFEEVKNPTKAEMLQAAVRRAEIDVEGSLFGESKNAGGDKAGESTKGKKEGAFSAKGWKGSGFADTGGYKKRERRAGDAGLASKGEHAAREKTAASGEAATEQSADQRRQKILDYVNRHRHAIELPEIVELARQLLGGKLPKLKKKIRDALGVFYPIGERGKINLRRDIFTDPEIAARVLAHEVGHLADYVSKRGSTMIRGNILGRIASLKLYTDRLLEEYEGAPGKLTDADRKRLRVEAERQVKEESKKSEEEIVREIIKETPIYREIGVTADMILDIWRGVDTREKYPELYRRLAEMSAAEKAAVVKQAMKQIVDERLKDLVSKEQIGVEVTKEVIREIKKKPVTQAWIKRRLRELIDEEINKRNLYKWETITKELKAFTMDWRPFDPARNPKYTQYRHSSVELYADAFSGLLNDPELLKRHAPTFYKAWHAYIDRKPDVKALYDEFTGASREDTLRAREERKKAGYKEAETIADVAARAKEQGRGWLQELYEGLIDKYGKALRYVKNLENVGKKFKAGENPRYTLEELQYIASEQYAYLNQVDQEIVKPLKDAGIDIHDFGLWHDYQNIIHNRYTVDPLTGERREMANPGGMTAQAAKDGLDALRKRLGDAKIKRMEEAFDKYWNFRNRDIFPILEQSRMLGDKLMGVIRNREFYGTTDVVEGMRKRIEKQYGSGMSGYIFPQKGTLAENRNPFIATVLKDMALIRAANVTIAKKNLARMLIEDYADEIAEPKTRWNGKFHETKEPENKEQGMLAFLEKGKVSSFYVPKDIADAFQHTPYEASKILKVWQKFNVPIRALLVNRNPLWMARNLVRDFLGTVKNNPEINEWRLLSYYKKVFVEAARDAYLNKDSDAVRSLMKNKALVIDRQYSLTDEPQETEIDRKMLMWGAHPVQYRNKVLKPIGALWDILGKTGKFTERLAKLAGAQYLKERTGLMPDEIAHRVRTRVGTPDVLRRGAWNTITNNLFLFSNVGKEGWRASWEALKEDKAAYAWKTVKFNIIPRMAFYAGLYGAFGDDTQNVLKQVGAYVRQNYLVVPLGSTPEGKGVILAIPQDYNGQVIGGLVDAIVQRNLITKNGILDYGVTQNPYNLHPYFKGAWDVGSYLSGENPYNSYYGEKAIPEREFKAGGMRKAAAFGKYMWSQMGGAAIYRFSSRTEPDVENEFKMVIGDIAAPLPRQVGIAGGNINLLNTQLNVGNFIRVVDQGAKEENREAADEVRKQRANTQLDAEDRIKDHIKENPGASIGDMRSLYRDLKGEGMIDKEKSFGQFRRQYIRLKDRAEGNAKLDAMIQAGSNEEKAALLLKWKREMDADDYAELEYRLRKDRLISPTVRRMMRWGGSGAGGDTSE